MVSNNAAEKQTIRRVDGRFTADDLIMVMVLREWSSAARWRASPTSTPIARRSEARPAFGRAMEAEGRSGECVGYLTSTPEKVSGVNSYAPIRHSPGWTSIVPAMVACILLPR